MDSRKDTDIRCGVEGSTRVGNPAGVAWRFRPDGTETLLRPIGDPSSRPRLNGWNLGRWELELGAKLANMAAGWT
jgi:hypothetical protein